MKDSEAIRLFDCLADRSRLLILKSLAREDMYVERLAERMGLTPPTISFHLKKLAEAGAVTSHKSQYYTMYSLNREIFQTTMLDILLERSAEEPQQAQRDADYKQRVVDSFFERGKLKAIPAQRKKKRIILEVIQEAFAPGRKYTEKEVNLAIADFHDDFCTLRREMIMEGLLKRSRDGAEYWRPEEEE